MISHEEYKRRQVEIIENLAEKACEHMFNMRMAPELTVKLIKNAEDEAAEQLDALNLEIIGQPEDNCIYYDCKIGEKCGRYVKSAELRHIITGKDAA